MVRIRRVITTGSRTYTRDAQVLVCSKNFEAAYRSSFLISNQDISLTAGRCQFQLIQINAPAGADTQGHAGSS